MAMEWIIRYIGATAAGRPALFLDRDGTIIENIPYLGNPADVSVISGAAEVIAKFRTAGYHIIVVTNQSGIARGLVTRSQFLAVEARVNEVIGPGLIDAVYACPFHPEGMAPFNIGHAWRKPSDGMLRAAAADFRLDLSGSVMIGDSWSDIQAGIAAGVSRVIHVRTGHGADERETVTRGFAALGGGVAATPRLVLVDSIAETALEDNGWDARASS